MCICYIYIYIKRTSQRRRIIYSDHCCFFILFISISQTQLCDKNSMKIHFTISERWLLKKKQRSARHSLSLLLKVVECLSMKYSTKDSYSRFHFWFLSPLFGFVCLVCIVFCSFCLSQWIVPLILCGGVMMMMYTRDKIYSISIWFPFHWKERATAWYIVAIIFVVVCISRNCIMRVGVCVFFLVNDESPYNQNYIR